MSPDSAIASLDQALAAAGEDIVLRRVAGSPPNTVNIDVACRAFVRSYRLKEENIASAIAEGVLIVTISPSGIAARQWPGGELPDASKGVADPSLPRRGDFVLVKGKLRSVQAVEPLMIGDQAVRFDMHTMG